MTSFVLRCIALTTMLLDHTGAVLLPQFLWMRAIGRIAFPLYCFLLAQGFRHTHSAQKYALRLLMFAILSEIPYNLLFKHTYLQPAAHNVFFSLLLGFCAMLLWKHFARQQLYVAIPGILLICVVAQVIQCDYGFFGILLILGFYLAGDHKADRALALVITVALNIGFLFAINKYNEMWRWMQLYSLFSIVPLMLYNGKPGYRGGKWAFYAFYPAHLLVLYWLTKLL